jgi:hypothetical protein
MAFVVNPNTGKVVDAQKKGKSKNGEKQYWFDKEAKSRFTTDVGAEDFVDQETKKILKSASKSTAKKPVAKKPVAKKPVAKTIKQKVVTTIKVNNNEVDKVEGALSVDQAFEHASDYFREITKTNVTTTKDHKGNVTHAFTVKTGSKG